MSLALPGRCREQKGASVHPEPQSANYTVPVCEDASVLTFERPRLHSMIRFIPPSFPFTLVLLLADGCSRETRLPVLMPACTVEENVFAAIFILSL